MRLRSCRGRRSAGSDRTARAGRGDGREILPSAFPRRERREFPAPVRRRSRPAASSGSRTSRADPVGAAESTISRVGCERNVSDPYRRFHVLARYLQPQAQGMRQVPTPPSGPGRRRPDQHRLGARAPAWACFQVATWEAVEGRRATAIRWRRRGSAVSSDSYERRRSCRKPPGGSQDQLHALREKYCGSLARKKSSFREGHRQPLPHPSPQYCFMDPLRLPRSLRLRSARRSLPSSASRFFAKSCSTTAFRLSQKFRSRSCALGDESRASPLRTWGSGGPQGSEVTPRPRFKRRRSAGVEVSEWGAMIARTRCRTRFWRAPRRPVVSSDVRLGRSAAGPLGPAGLARSTCRRSSTSTRS